ncbi:acyltransferase family protein [Prevotella sp. Rep29]|uniref:acyltransferase family protein n=1 Tax=Prevotella sp. Rep29 TaxID=2691580 RepID=UPI001C6E4F89|nr:acyltransferase family protein [Prevotella sp. Rep29]QYR10318.1 acyltransferase family protein [Prevotella sp. Rep29]
MKERLLYIDNIKGFALLIICLSHLMQAVPPLHGRTTIELLMNLTVPLFFFISGILYNPTKFTTIKGYINKKTKSLLVPYLFLSLLFIILCPYIYVPDYLVNQLNYPRYGFLNMYFPTHVVALIEWLVGDIICVLIGLGSRSSMPLWFVFILYLVSITFSVIYKTMQKWVLLIGFFSMLMALFLPNNTILLYLHIKPFFMAFAFYTLGFFYNKHIHHLSYKIKTLGLIISCCLYFAIDLGNANGFVNGNFGNSPLLFVLNVCSGIYILLFFFEILERVKFCNLNYLMLPFQYISRNGLPIIAVHFWAMLVYNVFFRNLFPANMQFLMMCLFVGIIVIVSVPLLNRYISIMQVKTSKRFSLNAK